MSKSYILLQMYDCLRLGGGIKIDDCCNGYDISVATFRRYISFLRTYFLETYGEEIVYLPDIAQYRLKGVQQQKCV